MSQGTMEILDRTGDTKIIWDSEKKEEVKNAKRTFDDLRKKGYIAYSVKKKGGKGKVLTEFDPEAERCRSGINPRNPTEIQKTRWNSNNSNGNNAFS